LTAGDWRTLAQPEAKFVGEVFAAQDREAAREYRRTMIESRAAA
jgi:hypothetical protein